MFKVNKKDRTYFTPCSSVSIVDFEDVFVCWVILQEILSQVKIEFCLSLQDPNQRVISEFFEELITKEEEEEDLPASKRVRSSLQT